MLKKYSEQIAQPTPAQNNGSELKIGVSKETINFLLNMSKSIECQKMKQEKVLVHLN